jgi:hypothetical protein
VKYGECYFVHYLKGGGIERSWFADWGAFLRWMQEGKRKVSIEADGDVMVMRDL